MPAVRFGDLVAGDPANARADQRAANAMAAYRIAQQTAADDSDHCAGVRSFTAAVRNPMFGVVVCSSVTEGWRQGEGQGSRKNTN